VKRLWLILFAAAVTARADVKLASVFTDHCVLQCDQPVPVWGRAEPGGEVAVEFAGQKKTAKADDGGTWRVTLDPLPASAEPRVLSANKQTIKDVLVGEVWLCSGQSNMAMPLRSSANSEAEIARADLPRLRMFTAPHRVELNPQSDCAGKWEVCSSNTAGSFSAVGYYFGRELHRELKVPIGLLHSSWGGTPAEAWLSLEGLRSESVLRAALEKREKATSLNGIKRPELFPTTLYNGMIAPLATFRMRGVIWYHGGANASGRSAFNYRRTLPALIGDWRRHWAQGEFPFYIVQLANIGEPANDPNRNSPYAMVRESQLKSLAVTNTALAVAIDLGESGDKHPKNKQDVGRRLSLLALAKTYGKSIAYSGPLYDGMKVEGSTIRIRLRHADGGLVATGGGKLARFAIAGVDRKFAWADAVIDGDTVIVASPQVSKPVAVRYAWADNPSGCNLANKSGLPASPFRTDEW
jgi:sialate O-acetylesterase